MTAVALVTGASGRLGGAVAPALSSRAYRVAAQGRNAARLARTVRSCTDPSDTVLPLMVDLTEDEAPGRVIKAVAARWGRLDVLVHCAAIFPATPLADTEWSARWAEVVQLNLTVTAHLVRAAVPVLREAPAPTIVLIGSEPVTRPAARPDREAYYASKGGLIGLARGLTASLGDDGIHTMVLHPGWIVDDTAVTDPRLQLSASDAAAAIAHLVEAGSRVALHEAVLTPRPTRKQ